MKPAAVRVRKNCMPSPAYVDSFSRAPHAINRHDAGRSSDVYVLDCPASPGASDRDAESGPLKAPRTRCAPLPLVGRGWGWGSVLADTSRETTTTPLPTPPPQGGREQTADAARS